MSTRTARMRQALPQQRVSDARRPVPLWVAGLAGAAGIAGAARLARGRAAQQQHGSGHGVDNPAPEPPITPVPPLEGRQRTVVADDGVTLHLEEHGLEQAAGTVVLAHGYVQSSRVWAGQVRDLSAARPDLKVVVYDHRGHGRSARTTREAARLEQLARDLVTVLDAVAPTGPVVLVGHSMGGMTIMALAEQRSELFGERVVGVGFVATSSGELKDVTYGMPRPAAAAFKLLTPRLNERALRREQAGKPRKLAAGTARLIFGLAADPEHVRETLEDMAGCSAETVAYFHATFSDHDRRSALAALADVPAVVLVGDRDLLCPLPHSQAIAAALPLGELTIFPGAGHMVQLERRPEVSRRLGALLDVVMPQAAALAGSASRA